MRRALLLSVTLMLLIGCGASPQVSPPASGSSPPPPLPTPRAFASCHVRGVLGNLPDPKCTPGKANAAITQANITETICNPAWHTSLIRPPESYTSQLKRNQIQEYGFADQNPSDYEEDHLVALTDGGDPVSPDNLWPQPKNPAPGYPQKDKVEIWLNHQICAGTLSLDQARTMIATDWTALYTQMQTRGLEPPTIPDATPVD